MLVKIILARPFAHINFYSCVNFPGSEESSVGLNKTSQTH